MCHKTALRLHNVSLGHVGLRIRGYRHHILACTFNCRPRTSRHKFRLWRPGCICCKLFPGGTKKSIYLSLLSVIVFIFSVESLIICTTSSNLAKERSKSQKYNKRHISEILRVVHFIYQRHKEMI